LPCGEFSFEPGTPLGAFTGRFTTQVGRSVTVSSTSRESPPDGIVMITGGGAGAKVGVGRGLQINEGERVVERTGAALDTGVGPGITGGPLPGAGVVVGTFASDGATAVGTRSC
jgi:hypothetical protein